jgi:CelD/BcsL family acetyltransferase involved in cellulose biosynthesis
MTLRIEVTTVEGLAEWSHGWDALAAQQPFPDPMRRSGWLTAWWRAFGAPRERREDRVLLVLSGDRLVAGAALMIERFPGGGVVVRHLGTSSHWFEPDFPVDPDVPEARILLARAIAAISCDLVVLEDLAEDSPTIDALAAAMPHVLIVPQAESHHRYRTLDPPSLRNRRKEARRGVRVAERAGHSLEVVTTEDPGEIRCGLDELFDLVDRSWRMRGDSSEVTHATGRRYVHDAIAGLGPGRAVLTRVRSHETLVAFDLALREGPFAVMFRGNWDPQSGVNGAGWMSMLAMLDHLVAAGAEVVDFGKFDWPYKRYVTSLPAVRLVTVAMPRGIRGRAALRLWRARPVLLAARDRVRSATHRARSVARRARPAVLGRS